MLNWWIFIAASAVFWVAVAYDAASFSPRFHVEYRGFLADKNGDFSLPRYVAIMIGIWAASIVVVYVGQTLPWAVAASALLVGGGVLRFIYARKNRALFRRLERESRIA